MKSVLGSLLAAALLVGTGHALKCYSCTGATSNTGCTEETCPTGMDSYCMSIYASGSGVSLMTKSCSPTCVAASTTVGGATAKTTCCNTDLCNGASNAKISYTLLSLAAGISALVVRAVL
ncbi:hypothetical protein NDU88_005099 [Pleurodeles waltl]|uniref:UPAR/Ly6 domain-containing protein n=1 Tax=Pleurodeles waltl TaxID=8319 RepID=A0AAV7V4U8_PLEWA|nr:hypothetical protein NDU88_005099 [Pleurodeles waltl]